MSDDPTHCEGHRDRLRERFANGGHEALLDHEIVEFLLMLAIPRIDTKPIAKRLIQEFGGLGPLLAADPKAIKRQGRIGDRAVAALKIAEASALRLLRSKIAERPVLASWQALLDYLYADMAHRQAERVRVLHLNAKNALIRDELLSEGTVDQASVHVREVMRRAIDLGSTALILVHNHPSGDPSPSRQDINLTREIINAARPLGINVHDHLIVGANGTTSLRAQGLM